MLNRKQLEAISATCGAGGHPETDLQQACDTALAAMDERDTQRGELAQAERALTAKGYRKACDIPACNCGDQWNHGGHAEARLSEIYDELGMRTQGKTALTVVREMDADLARKDEALRRARLALVAEGRHRCASTIDPRRNDCPLCATLNTIDAALSDPAGEG